jgi:hypothetical protein
MYKLLDDAWPFKLWLSMDTWIKRAYNTTLCVVCYLISAKLFLSVLKKGRRTSFPIDIYSPSIGKRTLQLSPIPSAAERHHLQRPCDWWRQQDIIPSHGSVVWASFPRTVGAPRRCGAAALVGKPWLEEKAARAVTSGSRGSASVLAARPSRRLMSMNASILVDSVGPPSAEVCRTAASFP